MAINIVKVTNKKLLKEFINLEWKIYKGNEFWVPPLKMDRTKTLTPKSFPFFEDGEIELFLAEQNGDYVGRIAAIINNAHNKSHNEKSGFFGFFESINVQSVANKLLETAQNWIKEKECDKMLGSASPSSTYGFGTLIDGFDQPPSFQMGFNLPYYKQLLENYGLEKAKDLYIYKISYKEALQNKQLERIATLAKETGEIKIRTADFKKNYHKDAQSMRQILNAAWKNNWGNSPMNYNEMVSLANDLKLLLDKDGILFAEIENKVVAFFLAIHNYNEIIKDFNGSLFPFNFIKLLTNKKKIKTGLVYLFGVLPEHRMKGIDALLFWELITRSYKHGVLFGETGWILEDNTMMNNAIKKFGGKINKTYRVFEKQL